MEKNSSIEETQKRKMTCATAVIAIRLQWGVLDGLFNGVKRDDKVSVLMNEESTPNWHCKDLVVFDFCTFFKKNSNFVSERASESGDSAFISECVESEELWPSLSLLASFDYRNRHG